MNEEQMFNGLARTVVTPQKAQTMALLFSFVRLRIHGGQRPSLHRE
jgi:predicted membrane protein